MRDTNNMRSFMKSETFGDEKLDKKEELNETMTVTQNAQDEYTRKIHNIGGNE